MSTSRISAVTGRAIVLRGPDIDTDRIIPARFLKTVTFEGLAANVFADDRAQLKAAGGLHPFDRQDSTDASVLIVNKNFGCGSSREHAPQALYRRGIRAVIGESFAEIFASNSLMIGLVCVTLASKDIDALMASVDGPAGPDGTGLVGNAAQPAIVVSIDLESETVSAAAQSWPLAIPAHTKDALISGQWDGAGLLLENYAEVEAVDARLPYSF